MQFFIAALIGALLYVVGSVIGRVLLALGVGFVTFTGISTLGGWIQGQMQTAVTSMPADAVALFGYLWVDKAITMIFSAFVAALAFRLSGSDTITSMVVKKVTT